MPHVLCRATCLAAMLAALAASAAVAADKIKATIPIAADLGYAMYHVAAEKGYFAEEGLDVEIIVAGGGLATPALISGDVQFSGSPGAAISAILKGAAIKLVFVTQDHPSYQLWASDPAIQTVQDLKGKQIGVISRGDSTENATRRVLKSAGVDPGSVAFSAMGFPQGRATALLTGALPAAALTFDDVAMVEHSPKVHLVADISTMVSMVVGGAVTSDRELASDRPLVIRFLRGLSKGFRYVRTYKDGTIDIMMKRFPEAHQRSMLEAAYDRTRRTMSEDGTVPDALAQQAIDENVEVLGIAPDKVRPLDEVFDFAAAREANRSLAAEGWTPQQ
jgi:ABC-type nitrate/sulfonate/bicarbonate transport system substrate-binding protein